VRTPVRRYVKSQDGFTLVEVVIASSIGAILMAALTSVIFTSWNAYNVASGRVEASGEIRTFLLFARDDFAYSALPSPSGCGSVGNPCTTQPLVLNGYRVTNSVTPVAAPLQVTYTWDGSAFLDRKVGTNPANHAATDVTSFSWYIDGSAPYQTVVVSMTVTVHSYSESQYLRFYPETNP
jgi:prepilin-type N-terminal cleavage/methylation domain-containing protein